MVENICKLASFYYYERSTVVVDINKKLQIAKRTLKSTCRKNRFKKHDGHQFISDEEEEIQSVE